MTKNLQITIKATLKITQYHNIAGILPENSRNRFVDQQSKKTVKKKEIRLFIEG